MISKQIRFFGRTTLLACDGNCNKAWGINQRERVELDPNNPDDYYWLPDSELGDAPLDPGTYEGGHGKPHPDDKLESKWCARECERSTIGDPNEQIVLPDFNQRRYNIKPHTREKA